MNNLLPKIDRLKHIAKRTNVAVIGNVNRNYTIPCFHWKFKLTSMTFFVVTEIGMEMGLLAILEIILIKYFNLKR